MYRDKNQRDFARHLRKEMTDEERMLWRAIRCEQLAGFKFRRQAAIGPYIVDFVCFDTKLIIELDGGQHNELERVAYDTRRTAWLNSQGFHVLRFWNFEVAEDCDSVIEAIASALEDNRTAKSRQGSPPSPSPSP